MPIVANNTTILFNDSTTQTTAGASGVNTTTVANSPGTWTKPASVKSIKVTVVGGGATGASANPAPEGNFNPASGGGGGGAAIKYYPAASLPGPQPYTSGGAGATSSFGAAPVGPISATGGTTSNGAPGPGGVGSGGTIVNSRGLAGNRYGEAIGGGQASGRGGSSIFGGAGHAGQPGHPTSYGAGGGGGITGAGGTGAPGVVVIEEFN